MLDGLDDIKWGELTHAYGSAADVPDLIRQLLNDDEETLEETFEGLFSNIWHQGTVYEASAYAVPFLIELVQSETVLMREGILSLLSCIASGRSYYDVHTRTPEERAKPEMQAKIAEEKKYERAAHEAVRKGIPVYLRLLGHQNPGIRTLAAEVLSQFPEDGIQIIPAVRTAIQNESASTVQADFLAHLGTLLSKTSNLPQDEIDACVRLLDGLLGAQNPPVARLSAAVTRTQQAKANTPNEAVDILVEALVHEAAYKPTGQQPTFFSMLYSTQPVIRELGAMRGVPVMSRILAAATNSQTVHECGRDLLGMVFEDVDLSNWGTATQRKDGVRHIEYWYYFRPAPPIPPRSPSLTGLQQQALKAVVESDVFWETVSNLLSLFGLPTEREALRTFVRDAVISDSN
ncbi:MAG: hypothetical protein K8L97_32505 [Anaerolineae bacterium]|nr:hypothetical protein [Anaerolineae bacterium]